VRTPSIIAVFGICATLSVAWTVHAGKDLNWDLLGYHHYVAHAWLVGRLGQDYFAASAQSYLNPLGYLPFYLAVSGGWHSVALSAALAAVHGASIALLYLIAWRLFAHRAPRERAVLSWLATTLGAATAVYWATVGTSFLDPLLTVPMLAGVFLLLGRQPDGAVRRAAWAGVLFGAAAGLKYSNGIFALAALALVVTTPYGSWAARLRALLAYAAGGGMAFAVLAGPSMVFLYREFGNPVFPLMNAWFESPDFATFNVAAERFAPRDIGAALARPFRMASSKSMQYVEISAPDLRFAALAVAAAASVVTAAWRDHGAGVARLETADRGLFAFYIAALALWLATSANGRYGMLVLLLIGPCLARVVDHLLPLKAARGALLVLLVVQITACVMVSPTRWFLTERWSRAWFPLAVPEQAQSEPALYLTVEPQTMSMIVPYLHPGSSFVNLRGVYSLGPGMPGWQRVENLLARFPGRARALGRGLRLQPDGEPRREVVQLWDGTLRRLGFRVQPADCFTIRWRRDDGDLLSGLANRIAVKSQPMPESFMTSCALQRAEHDPHEALEERRISGLFNRIEQGCARRFRGQTALTERLGSEWSRSYVSLEARLETRGGRVILAPFFALTYFDLGTLAEWERPDTPRPAACRGPERVPN